MSNYLEKRDKIQVHLDELYSRHRSLDLEIKEMHEHWERDDLINRRKTQKLWLKDEIHRIQRQLETIEDNVNGS